MASRNSMHDDDDDVGEYLGVRLRKGINLTQLRKGAGEEFEVDEESNNIDGDEGNTYFDSEQSLAHLNRDTLGGDDVNSDVEEDGGLMPFERLERNMTDISPCKDSKILKKVIKQGTGNIVPAGASVTVEYDGFLEFGEEPFDSTWLRNEPKKFRLGKGAVIPGLDLAIATMRKDEFSKFLIKPDYAYGELGCPPRIPAEATVLFEVKLLWFAEHACLDDFYSLPRTEQREAPFEQVLKVVTAENELAKSLYKQEQYRKAKNKYIKAFDILDQLHLKDEREERIMKKEAVKICNNVAMCYRKLCEYRPALKWCNQVTRFDGNNAKCYYQRGAALRRLGEDERAKSSLLRAQKLEPNDSSIAKELQALEKSMASHRAAERLTCQRMFQTYKKSDSTSGVNSEDKVQSSSSKQPSFAAEDQAECSESFRHSVQDRLLTFQLDNSVQEFAFDAVGLSPGELQCVFELAEELGMETIVKTKDGQATGLIKIVKSKDSISFFEQ